MVKVELGTLALINLVSEYKSREITTYIYKPLATPQLEFHMHTLWDEYDCTIEGEEEIQQG